MSKPRTITFTLSGTGYTTPQMTCWEIERLQDEFYDTLGTLSPDELKDKLQQPAVVMRLTTTILTLLFDAANLLPDNLVDAPFEKQRRYVSRLVQVEDLQGVSEALAGGMPGALKQKLDEEFPKALPEQTTMEPANSPATSI